MREVRIHLAFAAAARRSRPGHLEAGGAALLPARHPGTDAAQGQFRHGSGRARQRSLQRQREVLDLPRPAALHRARAQPPYAGRSRGRFVPGRPLTDSHVPHRPAGGTVDAPEGRLLPRRALRNAAGGDRSLRQHLEARADRPGKRRAGRVLEIAIEEAARPRGQCPWVRAPSPMQTPRDGIPARHAGRHRRIPGNDAWDAARTPRRTYRKRQRTIRTGSQPARCLSTCSRLPACISARNPYSAGYTGPSRPGPPLSGRRRRSDDMRRHSRCTHRCRTRNDVETRRSPFEKRSARSRNRRRG